MPNARVAELSSSVVPFVYFDAAICCGANYGVIQLELAAKTIVPDSSREAGARNEVVVTAHVRCSLAAAANLKETIERAIELERHSHDQDDKAAAILVGTAKLN
jgi:hypothetical protein